jgi:hypothetical protein
MPKKLFVYIDIVVLQTDPLSLIRHTEVVTDVISNIYKLLQQVLYQKEHE